MNKYKSMLAKFLFVCYMLTGILFQYGTPNIKAKASSSIDRQKVQILVKYKNSESTNSLNTTNSIKSNIKSKLKLTKFDVKARYKKSGVELFEIGQSDNINDVINELIKSEDIEYAQPNYKLAISYQPNDALYNQQWGLANSGQLIGVVGGTPGVDVNIEKAWGLTLGEPSVVVGVLDTGIDINHNDLRENIFINSDEITGNGIDDDGNGYIDDINGWDFTNNDNSVYDGQDLDKHGTHVAGIIAARSNNEGITGAAPNVRVLPLKFINGSTGYTSDAIEAIEYASQIGVKIINCSFGGSEENIALKNTMENSDILFVCAVGNNGKNTTTNPVYPACFKLPNVISVAAVNNNGAIASFSNYGDDIDIAAPGVGILSTTPENNYEIMGGTSMAAPFVAAAVALIKSYVKDITPSQIKERVKNYVTVSKSLQGKVSTSGRIDAYGSLSTTAKEPEKGEEGNTEPDSNQGDSTVDGVVQIYAATISDKLMEQIHYGENGVNPATGNYSTEYTDMSITSPGFVVNISRTYNSKDDRTTGLMRRGWTFGFEGSLKADTTNSSLWIAKLPNGSAQVFVKSGETYKANDQRCKLVKQADGTYILTTKDKYTYKFNTSGYLIEMKDSKGNAVTIEVYNTNGRVKSITDQVGRQLIVNYDANELISSINDVKGGKSVTYHYNTAKLLDKVTDPSGRNIYYEYDAENYLTKIKNNGQNVLETIVYDHNTETIKHRVTSYTDIYSNTYSYAYDITNKLTTITDLNNRVISKKYDTSFFITESKDPESKTTLIKYYVDSDGNNISGEIYAITDRNGNKTQYVKDNKGNITKIINPDNSHREYVYDSRDNLTMEKDEEGKCIFYVYDSSNVNLLKKVQPLNGTDVYTETADQLKFAVTSYSYYSDSEAQGLGYKAKGLLKSETNPEENTTSYTYDADGNIKTVTDPEGDTVQNSYNGIGWLISTISPSGYKVDYVYDNNGRLEKKVLNNGETIRTVYDIEGRKTQEIFPNNYAEAEDGLNLAQTQHVYNNSNVGYRYSYYTNGKVKTISDPEGNITTYSEYDKYGNLKQEVKPNGSVYIYEYDIMNRLSKVSFKDDAASQPQVLEEYTYATLLDGKTQKTYKKYLNGNKTAVTTYIYDYADRLVKQQNPDGGEETNVYYTNGLILSQTDANGGATYYKYDGLNRLTGQWTSAEAGRYSYTGITYDKAGRKVQEKTGRDLVGIYEISATDRLITKSYEYYADRSLKVLTDSSGSRTSYEYDKDGYVIKEIVFTGENTCNITEYENNQIGKPLVERVYVNKGDIYNNDFENTEQMVLTTTNEYDKNGNLKSTITPDGTVTTYVYDNMNRQIKMSQPGQNENGQPVAVETSIIYNWEGNPLTKTDPRGNVTEYIYNQWGLLEKTKETVKDLQGNNVNYITAYAYDLAGRKIIEVSPKNYDETAGTTLEQMNRTEFAYDSMDRPKTQTEVYKVSPEATDFTSFVSKAYKYDYNGNMVKELDGEGYASGNGVSADEKINSGYGKEYRYNYLNQVTSILDAVSKERGLSYTTQYQYDGAGRKVSETNGNGAVTRYYYNDAGNIIRTTVSKSLGDIEKTIKTLEYDLAGNVTAETDGNGNRTAYEYNTLNKVRKVIYSGDVSIPENVASFQYDVMGNLVKKIDTFGTMDLYTYDSQGRQLSHTQQNSNEKEKITTSVRYDLNSNIVFEIDGNGTVKENSYDGLNRLITTTVTVRNIDGKQVTHTTKFEYDKNGNQTKQIDWVGNVLENVYDPLNRLIEKKDPDGLTIQKYEYNRNHAQVKSIDSKGNETIFTYDKNNRLLVTKDPELHTIVQNYDNSGNIASKTDGKGNITNYRYDQFNRLIYVTNARGENTLYNYDLAGNMISQSDGEGRTTTFEYNAANKLLRKIDQGGRTGTAGKYSYEDYKVEKYTYYPNGLPYTKIDRNGNTTTYTYDCHGRMISQVVGDESIFYTYDNNGNTLTMKDSTGITARSYDELNRVTSKNVPNIGTVVYIYDIIYTHSDGKKYVGESSKDPKGNLTIKYYDSLGRLKLVASDQQASQFTTYEYDGNGNRVSIKYPSGAMEEYTYYKNNLLETLVNKNAAGTVLESYSYTYDLANNQISKSDAKGVTEYSYDVVNRLSTVKEPGGKLTEYKFDMAGNRTNETVTLGTGKTTTLYEYNEQNRMIATTAQVNNERNITKYSYDGNGNLTSKTMEIYKKIDLANPLTPHFGMFITGQAEGGITEYAQEITSGICYYFYDELNRMIKALPDGASAAEYKYNGEGLRVEKIAEGKTTRYMYEYDKVVLELDEKGQETARNIQGLNPISRTIDGTTMYYLYNGHADVTALIDGAGAIQGTYYYDAFGNIASTTGTVDNPFTYAGYQYDKETGLYYLNSRMYDPKTARFMQEDSYAGNINDPLSLNLYSYCHNEPIMYWDPTGHWKKEIIDGKTYAIAEEGDTLSGLAKEELGDASKWEELGYTGDPKKLQIGAKIDITKFNNTAKTSTNLCSDYDVKPAPCVVNSTSNPKHTDSVVDQGTGNADNLIKRLKSEPNNINYKKLLDIIGEHGVTDFTYEVFQSIIDFETRGTLESTNYILGNNFKYLAEYNGVSSYANFYVLMVDGEITLIRVGRDKTQVGFYDITKTDFFSQKFDVRNASSIFNDYLPTTGLDQDLNNNKKLSNEKYKFYENKASHTADIFWKHLKSDTEVIKKLARGLDTISGMEDNTGIATDFGDVYKATKYYPQKNNAFVLGEIYGHADGLNLSDPLNFAGENKYRYWVADVENPNTIPTDLITRIKQGQQNDRWNKYAEGR